MGLQLYGVLGTILNVLGDNTYIVPITLVLYYCDDNYSRTRSFTNCDAFKRLCAAAIMRLQKQLSDALSRVEVLQYKQVCA